MSEKEGNSFLFDENFKEQSSESAEQWPNLTQLENPYQEPWLVKPAQYAELVHGYPTASSYSSQQCLTFSQNNVPWSYLFYLLLFLCHWIMNRDKFRNERLTYRNSGLMLYLQFSSWSAAKYYTLQTCLYRQKLSILEFYLHKTIFTNYVDENLFKMISCIRPQWYHATTLKKISLLNENKKPQTILRVDMQKCK